MPREEVELIPQGESVEVPAEAGLPSELLLKIFSFAANEDPGTLGRLSMVSRHFRQTANDPELLEGLARLLMKHIVQGNAAAARALYEKNPLLLLIKIEKPITTYAARLAVTMNVLGEPVYENKYRVVKGLSPWQMAAGNGESNGRSWMLDEMLPFIQKLTCLPGTTTKENPQGRSGREEALEQLKRQFPAQAGLEDKRFEMPQSSLTSQFATLIEAVRIDANLRSVPEDFTMRPTDATQVLMEQLLNTTIPDNGEERPFTEGDGYFFNDRHLEEAYAFYDTLFTGENWQALNWTQRSYLWRCLIGGLQRLLPALDAQVFCAGVDNALNSAQLNRQFQFENYTSGQKVVDTLLPLRAEATFILGVHFGLYIYAGARGGRGGPRRSWPLAHDPVCLENYVKQKQTHLAQLCDSLNNLLRSQPITQPRNNAPSNSAA